MAKSWVRGVNLGGWLVLERWITPYLFALNSCRLSGNFCYYPNQIDAPKNGAETCDLYNCHPHLINKTVGGELTSDFPFDEYTLVSSFEDKLIATQYLENHYKYFVTREDIQLLKDAGVSHIRVPIPHWIFGDILEDEPWVNANGWIYFVRLVSWCRQEGIQVWPDLHTAPGSQNGFDNSGQFLQKQTCANWSKNPKHVKRTLGIVQSIAEHIKDDGLEDVVTGFGVLNEPFADCDINVIKQFNNDALRIIRDILGTKTMVFIGDMFDSTKWNNGWWKDQANTILDSHYYHVFAETPRSLSPKQHIAYVCRYNHRYTTGCCYSDHPKNTKVTPGISRMVGEWSASFDTEVGPMIDKVINGIIANYTAPFMDREISQSRQKFLTNFVKAQMVTYEAQSEKVSIGWFYWNFKLEGGAFAEWDFMRGIREEWIPMIPEPTVSSESQYGTCEEILSNTEDDISIVHPFPAHDEPDNWQGVEINDDLVLSVGVSQDEKEKQKALEKPKKEDINKKVPASTSPNTNVDDKKEAQAPQNTNKSSAPKRPSPSAVHKSAHSKSNATSSKKNSSGGSNFLPVLVLGFFVYAIKRVFFSNAADPSPMSVPQFHVPSVSFQASQPGMSRFDRSQYQSVTSHEGLDV